MYAAQSSMASSDRYARCIEVAKRIRWDIDRDVIRGRTLGVTQKFLPDGLSLVADLEFLSADEQRFLSQIQGRSYANIFGLVERFINAKILDISRDHWFGDQVALEALVGFSNEELKHQELFRRMEGLAAELMPEGYTFLPNPNDVASVVLGKSTWAVLGLTCHIEQFTQQHYKQSIASDDSLAALWKDVFLFHWKEESQHAIMDELEWIRENEKLSDTERDRAVNDLIDLVVAVDGILELQAAADADYFFANAKRTFDARQIERVRALVLKAYRWQYIVSGVKDGQFVATLGRLVSPAQLERVGAALAPLM